MKKKILAGTIAVSLLLVGIGILLIIAIYNRNQSPYDFVSKYKSDVSTLNAAEFLCQDKIGDNEWAVFYINVDGGVNCMIVKKDILTYHVLDFSGELSLSNDIELAGGGMWSSYSEGDGWSDWGIVDNDDIERVLIDGKETTILNTTREFRVFFIVGGNASDNIEERCEIIYKNGERLLFPYWLREEYKEDE